MFACRSHGSHRIYRIFFGNILTCFKPKPLLVFFIFEKASLKDRSCLLDMPLKRSQHLFKFFAECLLDADSQEMLHACSTFYGTQCFSEPMLQYLQKHQSVLLVILAKQDQLVNNVS